VVGTALDNGSFSVSGADAQRNSFGLIEPCYGEFRASKSRYRMRIDYSSAEFAVLHHLL